jgi:hypothetical protein
MQIVQKFDIVMACLQTHGRREGGSRAATLLTGQWLKQLVV